MYGLSYPFMFNSHNMLIKNYVTASSHLPCTKSGAYLYHTLPLATFTKLIYLIFKEILLANHKIAWQPPFFVRGYRAKFSHCSVWSVFPGRIVG